MSAAPKIFISATSSALKTARQAVQTALLDIQCHPVEQTHFPPDLRSVRKMLEERIDECQALIHVVGLRYGAEPDPASRPADEARRSYTQMEYHYARSIQVQRGDSRFRVYTFICTADFPYDTAADTEAADKQALQTQHRQTLLQGDVLYETVHDLKTLGERVRLLREETQQLRATQSRRQRWTWIGMALILLALITIAVGIKQLIHTTTSITQTEQQQSKAIQDVRSRLEEIISSTRNTPNSGVAMTPQQRYDLALAEVAFKHNLSTTDLQAAINAWTTQVKADPQASSYDLALAEYKANHFDAAAQHATEAYHQAMQQRQQATTEAIKAATCPLCRSTL